jgi:hypothetical protein
MMRLGQAQNRAIWLHLIAASVGTLLPPVSLA